MAESSHSAAINTITFSLMRVYSCVSHRPGVVLRRPQLIGEGQSGTLEPRDAPATLSQ